MDFLVTLKQKHFTCQMKQQEILTKFIFIINRTLCHINHSNFSFSNDIRFISVIEEKVISRKKKKTFPSVSCVQHPQQCIISHFVHKKRTKKRKTKFERKQQRKKWGIMFSCKRLNRNCLLNESNKSFPSKNKQKNVTTPNKSDRNEQKTITDEKLQWNERIVLRRKKHYFLFFSGS